MDIWTVFWRDWLVLNRRMVRFLLSRMVTPALYLVAFGWGLGRGIQMNGASYLDFIVPGIMALNSMTISFSAVGTSLSMSRLYHKTLEEYLIAPISSLSFVIGKVLAGGVRGLLSSLIIWVLAYLFGAQFIVTGWFVLALGLNCLLFAALGVVASMTINSHEDMANFSTYILLPMSFLCATFFSPERLPLYLRYLIEILPLTHASYALRALSLGGEIPWLSIAILFLYTIILVWLGVFTLEKARD